MPNIFNINSNTHRLIEALATHYSTVFFIDLATLKYEAIKISHLGKSIMDSYPDDIFNHYTLSTIAPEYQDAFRRFIDVSTLPQRLAQQGTISIEFRSVTEGRNWCRATLSTFDTEPNIQQVRFAIMMFEDIHVAKIKDQKLEQQLQYINGLISGYDVVLIYNLDTHKWTHSYVCETAPPETQHTEAHAHLSFSQMFIPSIRNYCHPDYIEKMRPYADSNYIRHVLKGCKIHFTRFLCFNQNTNDYRWVEMKIIKFEKVDQPAVNVAITFTDVDADERQKREQQAALEDVKAIIRASEMGIWHITLIQGKKPTMQADETMYRLLGLNPSKPLSGEDLYQEWYSRIDPDALPSVKESVARIITYGRDENTYLWNNPLLGPRYVRCGGTAKPILGGHLLAGYHYDVNESVKNEMRNKKIIEESLAANKDKSIFIHNMVHEIRNPLNSIIGFSQLLAMPDGSWSQKEKNEHYQQITAAYDMLSLLIDDVIDAADAEHGNYIVKISDVNINDACRVVIKGMAFRKPANVILYFTSDVDDNYTIKSDQRRICQVLANFLSNACKHTWTGEIRLHVSLTETPGHITFSVTDTGEGIPAAAAADIFKRFKKYNSTIEGSGIGLNICSIIAHKLNGEVRLDTTYTRGARFLFIL